MEEKGNTRIIPIRKYYGSLENMKAKFDRYARKSFFRGNSIEEYEKWKKEARETLTNLLGLNRMESVPLKPVTEEIITLENGIVREKVIIQTEDNVWMPMYILIPPKSGKEKRNVFLAPPGHQGAGKYSVAGCYEIPAVADAIKRFEYDYGMQLAKLGFITICPDCRGFGERRDEQLQNDDEESFLRSSCFQLLHMAMGIGETVAGMCVWDLMKAIDYIQTRTDWNFDKISCLGFSGGGMQTLYLSALEDRLDAVFISGYLYGFKDSLQILNGNCNCNYIPHLWEHFDMGDIAAMNAPRPLMIQSCRNDHLNGPRGMENVYEQMEIIKNIYQLYDADNMLVHDIHEGGHCWHGDNLAEILEKFSLL
ncbi:MAG: alpha/beta fold hydrolase [Lachnospiraceae bacterium]|nr:alpha/beta fold hydrolase [Lachnospiraceae bacterium]